MALHGVHHSKTPGHFRVRIDMALRLLECGVLADMECKMALHNTALHWVDTDESPCRVLYFTLQHSNLQSTFNLKWSSVWSEGWIGVQKLR